MEKGNKEQQVSDRQDDQPPQQPKQTAQASDDTPIDNVYTSCLIPGCWGGSWFTTPATCEAVKKTCCGTEAATKDAALKAEVPGQTACGYAGETTCSYQDIMNAYKKDVCIKMGTESSCTFKKVGETLKERSDALEVMCRLMGGDDCAQLQDTMCSKVDQAKKKACQDASISKMQTYFDNLGKIPDFGVKP